MISLQKFFGKTDVFYDLLEKSAEEAHHSVQALSKLITQPVGSQNLDELILSRRKDKRDARRVLIDADPLAMTGVERAVSRMAVRA